MIEHNEIEFLHFGIKSIDAQHQKFFGLLSELKIYNSNREDNIAKASILDEFKAYSQYHFELEKRIMTRVEYSEIDKHIAQHEIFIKKIDEFVTAYSYQSAALSEQMLLFLQKWFLVHIQEWDQNYVNFIHQRRESQA